MKSDNELANSIPVYFKSVKIGKFVLAKTKQNDQKKRIKKLSMAGFEPRIFDAQGQRVIYYATTTELSESLNLLSL